MIETEASTIIDAPLEKVWEYISDLGKWTERARQLKRAAILDAGVNASSSCYKNLYFHASRVVCGVKYD